MIRRKESSAIPSILQDALAVSFDHHVGHDYIEDVEERFTFLSPNGGEDCV